MSYSWKANLREVVPAIFGALSVIVGFVLMRVSAVFENWPLLFVSFILMIWGLVMLFTGNGRIRARRSESE